MKTIIFSVLCIAIATIAFSQPILPENPIRRTPVAADSTDKPVKDSSYFKASLSYLTNNVWQGRKNDQVQPYLTPTITYTHKSGLYADAGIGFIPYNGAGLDLVMLEAGYDHDLNDLFSLSLYGGKYFYASKSESVRSASGGSVSAGISFSPESGLFTLAETGGLNFADKTDYSSLTELSHLFFLGNDGQYSVGPQVSLNAGTQNYYSSYVENVPAIRRKRRGATTTTTVILTNTVMGASKFQVLDYELSCPLKYDAKKWGVNITPYYAIPKGAVSYRTSPGNKLLTEQLSNSFYMLAEAFVKF